MTSRIIVSDTATAEGQRVYNQITDLSRDEMCTSSSMHRAIRDDYERHIDKCTEQ